MLIIISILILACVMKGKDAGRLLGRLKAVDWHSEVSKLMDKIRPYALKVGRVSMRPILQSYYVLSSNDTPLLDKVLIYAAIVYTVSPVSLLPATVYKLLGILDEGIAMLFVYKRIKSRITPEINVRVEDTLNDWFGVEYKMVED